MPVSEEYVPRLSVEISEETKQRFDNAIPWGLKSKVMNLLLEDLLSLIETEGDIVIMAIVNRAIGIEDVMQHLPRREKG